MHDDDLIQAIEYLRTTLVSVSTGGPRIDQVAAEYQTVYGVVAQNLADRSIKNTIPYASLWDWHGRWSSGDLPTYRSRRLFVSELINPLLNQIRTGQRALPEPTGWARVDRAVGAARDQLASAEHEEHFQTVGLLCREVLISLAQAVYDPAVHVPLDPTPPSTTDAKRMLDAYVVSELVRDSNEYVRKHARSALELANHLQHTRTADFRRAAMCLEATTSVVNVIAIVAGKRDPH